MVPALFEATVRFFVPLRRTAAIRLSGTPQVPNPPERMTAPSKSFSIAASALATRLSIESDSSCIVARLFRGEGFLLFAQKGPASEEAGYSKSDSRSKDFHRAGHLQP